MKFKTHYDKEINTDGTGLAGRIEVDYKTLVKVFGDSINSNPIQEDANWDIEFSDGKIATIYNYKNGKNYLGKSGIPTKEITNWHVGGNDNVVFKRVKRILGIK